MTRPQLERSLAYHRREVARLRVLLKEAASLPSRCVVSGLSNCGGTMTTEQLREYNRLRDANTRLHAENERLRAALLDVDEWLGHYEMVHASETTLRKAIVRPALEGRER